MSGWYGRAEYLWFSASRPWGTACGAWFAGRPPRPSQPHLRPYPQPRMLNAPHHKHGKVPVHLNRSSLHRDHSPTPLMNGLGHEISPYDPTCEVGRMNSVSASKLCLFVVVLVMTVSCAPAGGQIVVQETASETATPTASPTPSKTRPPRTSAPRICGGFERPELSAAECELVNAGNLGLLQVDTCTTNPPTGNATAAVECRGKGMEIFSKGQEPSVYVFAFSNAQDLKDAFSMQAADLGIAEGDVQSPPAFGHWALGDDPPGTQRGQLMSRVVDGESLLIWTDWKELTWISAESSVADIKTLYSWWTSGNR